MSRHLKDWASVLGTIGLLGILFLLPYPTPAYQNYHDPNGNADPNHEGFCSTCHRGLLSKGAGHDMHVGNKQFTSECSLCHTGSGRNNPFIMWSGGDGTAGSTYGCVGCHGRDYGETIQDSYDNGDGTFAIAGLPKSSGYGLRRQHVNQGVTECLSCHADVPRCTILPEDVFPPNYSRGDVFVNDSCDSTEEDQSGELPPGGEDSVGLDNDGDGRYDQSDPDCNAAIVTTPAETSSPCDPNNPLDVTAIDPNSGDITMSYAIPCSASSAVIYLGPLTFGDIAAYNYTGQVCIPGITGTTTFNPGSGSYFFLAASGALGVQGSLGEAPSGLGDPNNPFSVFFMERPGDPNNACGLILDPNDRCD